jgi:hypothetical protein
MFLLACKDLVLGSGEPAGKDRTTNRRRVGLKSFKVALKDNYNGVPNVFGQTGSVHWGRVTCMH